LVEVTGVAAAVDRRDQLGRTPTEVVSRLHHLLLELVPGGAKQSLSAQQARALLNTVRPRDVVGKTRRWAAPELIHELVTIDKKIKIANQELTELVASTGSRLQDLHGIGPSGAAAAGVWDETAPVERGQRWRRGRGAWDGTAAVLLRPPSVAQRSMARLCARRYRAVEWPSPPRSI
jgi:hypothetical protein